MKFIIQPQYAELVFNEADALAYVALLERSEIYVSMYRDKDDGGTTHHVHERDPTDHFHIRGVSEDFYNIAKLAGKPIK